jgi:hypothetical protein
MISRSYAWLDENIDHSDEDHARATALAAKWSHLQTVEEDRSFRRMADIESGYDYDPYEDCECDWCLKANHRCNGDVTEDGACEYCDIKTDLTECESRAKDRRAKAVAAAERDLEIELVEDKLTAMGARMMRPYEHWHEDERYMQYMESDRFAEAY